MRRAATPSSSTEAVPSDQLVEPQGATAVLRDRVQAIGDALTLLRGLELAELESFVGQAAVAHAVSSRQVQKLVEIAGEPPSEVTRAAEEAVTEAERALVDVLPQVSAAAFCEAYERLAPSATVAARCARLLARTGLAGENTQALYAFIVSGLLRREDAGGAYELVPEELSGPLLDDVAPVRMRSTSEERKWTLIGQLEATTARISTAGRAGKAAIGGFLEALDQLGPELGADLADPDLLLALARVRNAIANKDRPGAETRPSRVPSRSEVPVDTQESAAAPEHTAAVRPDSGGEARVRALAVREVHSVFQQVNLDAEDKGLQWLGKNCTDCEQAFEQLEQAGFTDRSAQVRFAAAIETAEVAALSLNEVVPMDRFARGFDRVGASRSSIAYFLSILSTDELRGDERRDQFEFLVTRLLRQTVDDGGQRILPREEADLLLAPIASAWMVLAAESDRAGVESFFEDARSRLAQVSSVEDLVRSGLYAHIYSFKRSLGEFIRDPAIAYTVARANIALANRLRAFADSGEPGDGGPQLRAREGALQTSVAPLRASTEFDARFSEERRKARDAADRSPGKTGSRATAGWTAGAPPALALESARELEASSPAARTRARRLVVVAVVCALLLIAAVVVNLGDPYPSTAYSTAQVQALSPHLASGRMLDEQQVFVGELRGATWSALSRSARADEAARLRRHLAARGVTSAIISLDGRPVLRFRSNEPLQLMD